MTPVILKSFAHLVNQRLMHIAGTPHSPTQDRRQVHKTLSFYTGDSWKIRLPRLPPPFEGQHVGKGASLMFTFVLVCTFPCVVVMVHVRMRFCNAFKTHMVNDALYLSLLQRKSISHIKVYLQVSSCIYSSLLNSLNEQTVLWKQSFSFVSLPCCCPVQSPAYIETCI